MIEADKLYGEERFPEAKERLVFLTEKYKDSYVAEAARKKLAALEDEITAAQMLLNIQKVVALRSRRDAQRMLKELSTNYSWTKAGERAQRILRGSDDPFVKAEGDSLYAKVAQMQKWKMLETTNFIIYYQNSDFAKEVAKAIEEVLKKVVVELSIKDVTWKYRKCKIFLFDEDDKWKEFKKNADMVTEWASGFAVPSSREIYGNA